MHTKSAKMDLIGTVEDDDSLPEEETEESDVDEGNTPVRINYSLVPYTFLQLASEAARMQEFFQSPATAPQ